MTKRRGGKTNRKQRVSAQRSYGGNESIRAAQYRRRRRRRIILKNNEIVPITTEAYRKQRRDLIDEKIRLLRQALGTAGTQGQSKKTTVRPGGRIHLVGTHDATRSECHKRSIRRKVLFSNGTAGRPGSAPGPYKPPGGKC